MSDIAHHTDSALASELVARRAEIRRKWLVPVKLKQMPVVAVELYPTQPYVPPPRPPLPFPPLPVQSIKPLAERMAEADVFKGELPGNIIKTIKEHIRRSARECGETRCKAKIRGPKWKEMITDIQKAVADRYGIEVLFIVSNRRYANMMRARHIAMYLCMKVTGRSLDEIGSMFGGRDHSSVWYAAQKIERLMRDDPWLAVEVAELKGMLGG